MFIRLIVLIVLMTAAAATLLDLRQRRTETMHEMAVLQGQITQSRHAIWGLQSAVAEYVNPKRLGESIARAQIDLEPLVADGDAPSRHPSLAYAISQR